MVYLQMVTHLSTNPAQRRVTSAATNKCILMSYMLLCAINVFFGSYFTLNIHGPQYSDG